MSHGSTWVWGGRITGQIASTRALDAEERMFVDLSSGVTDQKSLSRRECVVITEKDSYSLRNTEVLYMTYNTVSLATTYFYLLPNPILQIIIVK